MISLNPYPSTVKNGPTALTSRNGSAMFIARVSNNNCDDNPAEVSSIEPSKPLVHHPEFFFDNTLIAIQIENTLFNVHKYQLAKSEFFSEIFNMPKIQDGDPEAGSSPEHPIVIQGAVASDFAALLRVLYASHFSSNPPAPEAPLIIPAFRLANLLSFSELRAYLLPLAEENLEDVDKIVFAKEFDIKEWLGPAHIRLCKREAHLSTEEARKLGVDSVLMVSQMREKHRIWSTVAIVGREYCYNCVGITFTGTGRTCSHCNVTNSGRAYFRCDGPGKLGGKMSLDEPGLEAEVTKWVEDGYVVEA